MPTESSEIRSFEASRTNVGMCISPFLCRHTATRGHKSLACRDLHPAILEPKRATGSFLARLAPPSVDPKGDTVIG